MKRDVKSFLPVSLLAAMNQPSISNVDIPLGVYVDIRYDSEFSDSADIVDDSIPITDGIPPLNICR
jgi:hypothetical protein